MNEIFIVYLYCDYRKEVDLQHLKAFTCREQAIEFAKKYSADEQYENEYVCIKGSEYDALLCNSDDKDNLLKELNIKLGMWYIRIAVDKVILE